TAQPRGGQAGTAQVVAAVDSATASSTVLARPRSTRTAAISAAIPTAPSASPRHGTDAKGTPEAASAIRAITSTARPGTHAAAAAPAGQSSAAAAVPKPPTIATGTSGAAAALAGTETQPTSGWSRTRTGRQARCEAAATASTSAAAAGIRA